MNDNQSGKDLREEWPHMREKGRQRPGEDNCFDIMVSRMVEGGYWSLLAMGKH
jgi:hypothetical protein